MSSSPCPSCSLMSLASIRTSPTGVAAEAEMSGCASCRTSASAIGLSGTRTPTVFCRRSTRSATMGAAGMPPSVARRGAPGTAYGREGVLQRATPARTGRASSPCPAAHAPLRSGAGLATLDELADLLPALPADLLVERVTALVTDGDASLAPGLGDGHRLPLRRRAVGAVPPRCPGAVPLPAVFHVLPLRRFLRPRCYSPRLCSPAPEPLSGAPCFPFSMSSRTLCPPLRPISS